jgi:hypothetical protein
MSAPVIEEKQQQQATTTNPASHSVDTPATNSSTAPANNHDNPPSFEDATGISSRDTNTITSPPPVGSPPARDLPPGIVNEEQATTSPGVNNYGYVASPPGGMNHHPQGMGQPVVNYEGAPQMVTPLGSLGEGPALIDCPHCHRRAMTKTDKEGTSMQMIAGAICCLFCICLTCVPCLAGWCENVNIHCSACGKRVATIPHDGTIQVHWPQTHTQVPSQYPAQGPPQQQPQGPPQEQEGHELQPQSPPPAVTKA